MPCFSGHAVEKLHDHEPTAVFFADVVNGADVRVVERGGGLGLATKPFQGLIIVCDCVGQELQRDETIEPRVLGLVNQAHPTAAQFAKYAIVRDRRVDH